MYRGMHYPLDVTGGALLGIAALVVIVFACRAGGAAAQHEQGQGRAS
jgi:membrane-associated phospholipid phosphatase